eukprot:sb/3469136/
MPSEKKGVRIKEPERKVSNAVAPIRSTRLSVVNPPKFQRKSVITGDVVKDLMKASKASRDIKRQQQSLPLTSLKPHTPPLILPLTPNPSPQFALFENFFKAKGSRVLLVIHHGGGASEEGKEKKTSPKLLVTSGLDIELRGSLIYFFRTETDKAMLEKMMERDVYFGHIEAEDGDVLTSIQSLLNSLIIPMLQSNTNWGKMEKLDNHKMLQNNFISSLDDFSKLLNSAKANLSETYVN